MSSLTGLVCVKCRRKEILIRIKTIQQNAGYDKEFEETRGYAKGKQYEKKEKQLETLGKTETEL